MADFEMEIILDYLNGSKVITRVLINGRGRKKRGVAVQAEGAATTQP